MSNTDNSAAARIRTLKGRAVAATHARDVATPPSQSADRSGSALLALAYTGGVNCCGPTAPADPQGTPFITNVTPGDGSLEVEFELQRSLAQYTVYATPQGGPASTATGPISPIKVTGLTNGVAYDVRVKYVTSDGTTTESETLSNNVPVTVPGAPTITGIVPTNGVLTVNFTAPSSNGGSAITNYKYSIDGGATFTARSPASVTTSLIISTGLTNGIEYDVVIRAVNAVDDGAMSNIFKGTPASVPGVPTITTIERADQSLVVYFTPPVSNGGSAITTYAYSTNGTDYTDITPADTTSPITVPSLLNGTTYNVTIKAKNSVGLGVASNSVSGTPSATPPSVPGAPTINRILADDSILYVYASPPIDTGGATITNYAYSTDNGETFTVRSPSSTTMPLAIPVLINGTTYNVVLKAINSIGQGTASAAVDGIPVAVSSASPTWWIDPTDNTKRTVVNNKVTQVTTKGTVEFSSNVNNSSLVDFDASNDGVFNFTGQRQVAAANKTLRFTARDFGNTITVSAWIYPRLKLPTFGTATGDIGGLLTNVGANVAPSGFKFQIDSWLGAPKWLSFQAGNGSTGGDDYTPNNTIVYDQWQHIAYEFDKVNRTIIFFRNGEPAQLATTTDGLTVANIGTNQSFAIGGYTDGSYVLNAKLGDLKVYDTLLDATQIRHEYTSQKSRFGL
jgi:hypothetical protein